MVALEETEEHSEKCRRIKSDKSPGDCGTGETQSMGKRRSEGEACE